MTRRDRSRLPRPGQVRRHACALCGGSGWRPVGPVVNGMAERVERCDHGRPRVQGAEAQAVLEPESPDGLDRMRQASGERKGD